MNARELRIGNFVDRNGLMEIISINENKVRFYDHYNRMKTKHWFKLDEFTKSIPLTEDFLLKLGFKKWNTKELIYSKKKLILHKRKDGWVLNRRTKVIIFVHQLQNLYFALTGEELELKEE
jgi:hypothetical protein